MFSNNDDNFQDLITASHDLINAKSNTGETALMYAAEKNNFELAKALIDYNPEFDIDDGLKITIEWFTMHLTYYRKFR